MLSAFLILYDRILPDTVLIREALLLKPELLRVERAPRTSGLGVSVLVSMLAAGSGSSQPELGHVHCERSVIGKGEQSGAWVRGPRGAPRALEGHSALLG